MLTTATFSKAEYFVIYILLVTVQRFETAPNGKVGSYEILLIIIKARPDSRLLEPDSNYSHRMSMILKK